MVDSPSHRTLLAYAGAGATTAQATGATCQNVADVAAATPGLKIWAAALSVS